MKPTLKRINGRWLCSGNGQSAIGRKPSEAMKAWGVTCA